MASDVKRPIPDLAYVSPGAASTIDLPRDHTLKRVGLMFTLAQATATTPASGTEPDGGILAAIRRLEVVADGAVTLWSIDPISLYTLNALYNGTPAQRDDLAPPGGSSSNTLQAYLEIPFALPFAKNPDLTMLNAAALSSLQLRVTWGSVSDLYQTVANTTITAASTILSGETHEIVGLDPRSVFSAFKVSQLTRDISAANQNLEIDLPRSNVLRGLLLKARVTTNSVEDQVDTIVNEVRVESSELGRGPFVHRRSRATDTDGTARNGYHMRNAARLTYGLNDLYTVEAGQQDFSLTGFLPLEFMENQRVTSAIRAQAFSSLKAILNVSAPSGSPQVIVNVMEIIPAARPRAA